jgi:hypothetical protein
MTRTEAVTQARQATARAVRLVRRKDWSPELKKEVAGELLRQGQQLVDDLNTYGPGVVYGGRR